jgi:hypothetical protein
MQPVLRPFRAMQTWRGLARRQAAVSACDVKPPGTAGPVARTGGVAYLTRTLILMTTMTMMIGSHPCLAMAGFRKAAV